MFRPKKRPCLLYTSTSSAVHAVGDVVTGGGEAAAKAAAEPVYWNYGAFIQQLSLIHISQLTACAPTICEVGVTSGGRPAARRTEGISSCLLYTSLQARMFR